MPLIAQALDAAPTDCPQIVITSLLAIILYNAYETVVCPLFSSLILRLKESIG